MSIWQDPVFLWSMLLVVLVPLFAIALTELEERLARVNRQLAATVSVARNLLLPVLVLYIIVRSILDQPAQALSTRLVGTLFWIALLVFGLLLFRQILAGSTGAAPGWKESVPSLLLQLPRVLLVLVVLYWVLAGVWRVNVGELITALGIGSLVIALALQDTLSNLFSGLLLLLNRPFQVGDWIRTGDVEGRVLELNWRNAHVRTRDNDLIVIPNGSMAKSSFKNYSRPTTLHRVKEEIDFHIDNPPNLVRRILEETALDTPGVLSEPAPDARTAAYDGLSIRYKIFFWIEDYGPVAHIRNRFLTRLYYRARRAELRWSTPRREVHFYRGDDLERSDTEMAQGRRNQLQGIAAFAMLPAEAVDRLADAALLVRYGADETIVREGEKQQGVFVLLQGSAMIQGGGPGESRRQLLPLQEGDLFGETGLFGRAVSGATVVAQEDAQVLLIPRSEMLSVIGAHQRFAEEMNVLIEERRRALRRMERERESVRANGSRARDPL